MKAQKYISAMNYIDEVFIEEANKNNEKDKEMELKSNNIIFGNKFVKYISATAAALAIIAATVFMYTPKTNNDTAFGLMVVSADDTIYTVSEKTTVQLPVKAMLRVEDIRNVSSAQRDAFQENMVMEMEKYLNYDDKNLNGYGYRCHPTETAIIYYGYMNDFVLNGIDTDNLSQIKISLNGIGELEINNQSYGDGLNQYGKEFVISAEEYKNIYADRTEEAGGMRIGWMFGSELINMFTVNPATPLSSINDTITFKVEYIDGSCDSYDIEICFNDSGEMSAVYKKSNQ